MKKRLFVAGLTLALALSTWALAASEPVGIANVETHTAAEIIAMYQELNLAETVPVAYDVQPDLEGLTHSGSLTDAVQQNALDTLNFVRYIAGLSYDVVLNDDYVQMVQDGTLVLAANSSLTHYPSQPEGMSDALYQSGADACKSSNLSSGHSNLYSNIITGWMGDYSSTSNLQCVGHRRWVLNPSMTATGFGFAGRYSGMYAHDNPFGSTNVAGVVWPAQTMPVEYFKSNYPWSYSLGKSISTELTVTLTRQSDGETWEMYTGDGFTTDGSYALIDNSNYGRTGCVIFRPSDVTYTNGDVFHVSMVSNSGTLVADYTVTFMSLEGETVEETQTEPQVETQIETDTDTDGETLFSGASTWAQSELIAAYEAGYPTDCLSDRLQSSITRGDFCYMLGLFFENQWEIPDDDVSLVFTDIANEEMDRTPNRNWYICYLNSLGVITGTSDTTFAPDDSLTREQMAIIMLRTARLNDEPVITQDLTHFTDSDLISSWALEGMQYMNQVGAINGISEDYIDPQGDVSVEQAALICYRFFSGLS